ncbi:hypothetical protein Sjap_009522 [Stephania japonica]|uniref:HIT domain-containing protein n=1 Tax=Stephania japonica TaxID=461633 RepID=A0AAP0JRH1_9MAGN
MNEIGARRLSILRSHLRDVHSDSSASSFGRVSSNFSLNCATKSSSDDGSEERDCVFCKIIRGDSPSFKIYEDDVCLCILDINPLTHGHSLIIPKHHFSSLKSTPPSVVASMCSKVPFVSNAVMEATNCDSFNLLVNTGEAAGQVIFHTHLHIIPRKARDRLWTSKSFRRLTIQENHEATQLADCIKKHLILQENNCEDEKSELRIYPPEKLVR